MLAVRLWVRPAAISRRRAPSRSSFACRFASVPRKVSDYNNIQDQLDQYDNDFEPSFLDDDHGPYESEMDDSGQPPGSILAPTTASPRYVSQKPFSINTKPSIDSPIAQSAAAASSPSQHAQEAPAMAPVTPKPPIYLGGYNLSPESWVPDLDHDLLIEFAAAGVRRLGLVQRPKGKRDWIVLDDAGDERKVNQYAIYFQFPRPAAWKEMSLDSLKDFRRRVQKAVEINLEKSVNIVEVWKKWYQQYGTKEVIPYYEIAKDLLPEYTTYTPEQIYTCHVYLTKNEPYFAVTPRGFKCRDIGSVLFRQEMADVLEEQRIAKELFVAKLRYKLNQLKAQRAREAQQERFKVTTGKETETLEIAPRPGESEAEFLAQAPAEIDLLDGIPEDLKDEEILREWDPENDIQFLNQLKNYALTVDGYVDATVFANFLYPLGYGDKPSDAFDLLTDLGFWDKFENPHLLRWQQTPLGFSPSDALEAQRLIQKPPPDLDYDRRVNFGDLPVFAVDPVDPHDVDDAISLYTDSKGDDWIYVHIADVGRWIEPNSQLDVSARTRTNSIYLPEAYFPMIPDELTQHMSLREGKGPKQAMSFGVRLDDHGRIDRYRIIPSTLNNIINLSYDELNTILTDDAKRMTKKAIDVRSKHYDVLLKLAEFAKRRRTLRIDQGAVIVVNPQPEVRVKADRETGKSIASFSVENDFSRNSKGVVMEMMLLVGEISANFFNERGTPVLYRVQPLSSATPMRRSQQEIAQEKALFLSREQHRKANIIAQLDKAKQLGSSGIDTVPKKHFGYGLNMFVSITSPLRRYTDLINLYQLKSALRREATAPFSLVQQYEILPLCQSRSEDIKALQRDSARFWILGYLETQWQSDATRLYLAVVVHPRSDTSHGQAGCYLPQLGIEADVQVERAVMRGESLQVRVDFVNPFFDKLILKEADRKVHLF